MNYPTHMGAIPPGMLIDVRQQAQAANPVEETRKINLVAWRKEWDAVVRRAAIAGQSAAQIAEHYGVDGRTAQRHLTSLGLQYDAEAKRWKE